MNDRTPDAGSVFAPILKRWWLIVAVGVLAAAGTYEYYKHQPASYLAKTQLYLAASEQANSAGVQSKSTLTGRALADQVELINSSVIGLPVRKRLRAEGDIKAVKGKAKATASATSDFITIAAEARTPKAAVDLANAYAAEFLRRHRADFTRSLRLQIATARQQLRRLEASSTTSKKGSASTSGTLQAASIASKISQLETQLAGSTGVEQVSPAKANPLPVSASPKKNAIFGGILGLLLAAIAVYMLSRLNRRLSSLEHVEYAYGHQLLTALPKVKNPIVTRDGVRAPSRPLIEPLRRLHTTLQLSGTREGGVGGGVRAILFLSAEAGDGSSTAIANLARVQRDAGARVVVVEADFRRPVQAQLLDVDERGVSDVLTGAATVEELAHVQAVQGAVPASGDGAQDASPGGELTVLPCGSAAANPPALLASEAMKKLLRTLRDEHDFVLIDCPSLLEVSDAMPLLAQVDGIVLVARIGHTREVFAERLMSTLGRAATAPVLGVVANCASRKDAARYGLAWAPATSSPQPKLLRR